MEESPTFLCHTCGGEVPDADLAETFVKLGGAILCPTCAAEGPSGAARERPPAVPLVRLMALSQDQRQRLSGESR